MTAFVTSAPVLTISVPFCEMTFPEKCPSIRSIDLKRHFAGKIHHVTDETKPIIFVDVRSIAVDESRLAAFVSARNCLSSHWLLPFFLVFLLREELDGLEAAGCRRR